MSDDGILIAGAREHNLKNITVRIPRGRLTVITGLSGSGKSSLAFDTLYAEGQRRYVEGLSAYARQFLDRMQKPDVDRIEGLSPAIAIEQRTAGSNPRSIVATATEIHDYFRLLFSAVGKPHCPACGRRLSRTSAEQMVDQLLALPAGTRVCLLAPQFRDQTGRVEPALAQARRQGFVRVRLDGEIHDIDAVPPADPAVPHSLEVVIDRLVIDDRVSTRLTDSAELALRQGDGLMIALTQAGEDPWREILFSDKFACPHCAVRFDPPSARHFSFNSPYGACPTCSGLGTRLIFDEDLIVPDPSVSIEDGAIQGWRRGGRRLILYYKRLLRALAKHDGFSLETPFRDLSAATRRRLLHGTDEDIELGFWRAGAWRRYRKPFEGVIPNLQRRYDSTDSDSVKQTLRGFMSRQQCPDCRGARLKPFAIACTVGERSIVDVVRMSVREALRFFDSLALGDRDRAAVGEVLKEIRRRLSFLVEVGLGYLTLDRESGSLSGGEAQRIRLATQIGSGLVGVLYVLDEPTIGLHARDTERLIETLKALRDQGNTVVVVEHDEATIRQADHVVDLGPGAGRLGGNVVFAGTVNEMLADGTSLTARYLNRELTVHLGDERKKPDQGTLRITGARENNLKNLDVAIPLGLFVCVTGVSGSGKSSLVDDTLRRALARRLHGATERPGRHRSLAGVERLDKVIVIDQSPIGRTPRSNPATYTGAFDPIRQLFARTPASKVRGYGPARYSFNVKGGRCETCRGDGALKLEMHFLPDVYVPCEQCQGTRYNRETLEIRYAGRNIAQVLSMTVDEGMEFFRNVPPIERRLKTLSDVGLGYLNLGQAATTLSGGEAQRVKLSAELCRTATGRTLYLLDEPTTGLHFGDTHRLLRVLRRLRDAGNTVLVVEHNPDVIRSADYIIDLGPEGGDEGGHLVAQGTPEEVAQCAGSHTGALLRRILT